MHAISYAHFSVPKLQPHPYHPVFHPYGMKHRGDLDYFIIRE